MSTSKSFEQFLPTNPEAVLAGLYRIRDEDMRELSLDIPRVMSAITAVMKNEDVKQAHKLLHTLQSRFSRLAFGTGQMLAAMGPGCTGTCEGSPGRG